MTTTPPVDQLKACPVTEAMIEAEWLRGLAKYLQSLIGAGKGTLFFGNDITRIERIADLLAMNAARPDQGPSDAVVERVVDWWKPDPEDPFWMLEATDGEWLKNKDSMLGTRDATKALRFPTARLAANEIRYDWPARWWSAKPTEHLWITALQSGEAAQAKGE